MKVFSKTHVLTVLAAAFHFAPKSADGKALPKTNLVQAPVGTVVNIDDDEARNLVNEGLVQEYSEDDHKAVDGVVPVASLQSVESGDTLPEGMTRPSVIRQDESLNDGRKTAVPGIVVVGDTKENAARAAEQAKADAEALAAKGLDPAP